MKDFKQPVIIFLFFLFANLPLYILLPKVHFIPAPFNFFGLVVILLGLIINLSADHLLRKNHSFQGESRHPKKLVFYGIYKFLRHPMYTGMVIVLIGFVLFFNSIALFILPFVFSMHIIFFTIPYEERQLMTLFPKEYPLYQKKTSFLSIIRTFFPYQKKGK